MTHMSGTKGLTVSRSVYNVFAMTGSAEKRNTSGVLQDEALLIHFELDSLYRGMAEVSHNNSGNLEDLLGLPSGFRRNE